MPLEHKAPGNRRMFIGGTAAFLLLLSACAIDHATTRAPTQKNRPDTASLCTSATRTGMFVTMADAGLVTECSTRFSIPGEHLTLYDGDRPLIRFRFGHFTQDQ